MKISVDLAPELFQRVTTAAESTGRTLQEYARDALLQSVTAPNIPDGVAPGVTVEWDPEYARGPMRGRVTRVEHGRVFVEIRPARRRKPAAETWFEPDEVNRLRAVTNAQDGSASP